MFGFTHVRDRVEGPALEACDEQPASLPTPEDAAPRLAFRMEALESRAAPGVVWGS
jgi:hypothetical protein